MSTHKQTGETIQTQQFDKIEQTLEANGVEVVSLEEMAADPHLRYRHDPDARKKIQTVIALVFADAPDLVRDTVQATPVDDSRTRVGYFYIDSDLIDRFCKDEIEKKEYVSEVVATWSDFGSSGGR